MKQEVFKDAFEENRSYSVYNYFDFEVFIFINIHVRFEWC